MRSKFVQFSLCLAAVCCLFGACSTPELAPLPSVHTGVLSEDSVRIMERMRAQEKAWSAGDLDGFMEAYWKSDSLLFVGSRGPSLGWQTTLDNYSKSYTSPEEMGTLSFNVLDMEPAGHHHVLMVGSWRLNRTGGLDALSGWFSLVWARKGGDWVIIRDHSS